MHYEFISSAEQKSCFVGQENVPGERRVSFYSRFLRGRGKQENNLHD